MKKKKITILLSILIMCIGLALVVYSLMNLEKKPEPEFTSNPSYVYRLKHSHDEIIIITERADMGCERLPCNITTNFIVNTTEFPLDKGDVLNLTWTGILEKSKEGIMITVVVK